MNMHNKGGQKKDETGYHQAGRSKNNPLYGETTYG